MTHEPRSTSHGHTNDPGLDNSPAWSPEGDLIAFGSTRDSGSTEMPEGGDIYVMNPDGTDVRRVTTDQASFTPGGRPTVA
jgi:Tol biopolymer transport system component